MEGYREGIKRAREVDKNKENERLRIKNQAVQLTRQITLRVLLELCNPLVEVLLLLLAVLQRSSLQLRVVSLYSQFVLAMYVQN